MKDLFREVKYELIRTLKHIFYVLLVICWFAFWYVAVSLIVNEWNIVNWHKDLIAIYCTWSFTLGIGYLIYRITT